MPLTISTEVQASLKLLVAQDTTFKNRMRDILIDLDQTTENAEIRDFLVEGQVTDQAIEFGKVLAPTFILISVTSLSTGGGTPDDGTHQPVTFSIGGNSIGTTDYVLLTTQDATNDTLTDDITFTTLADTNTEVCVTILGRVS